MFHVCFPGSGKGWSLITERFEFEVEDLSQVREKLLLLLDEEVAEAVWIVLEPDVDRSEMF